MLPYLIRGVLNLIEEVFVHSVKVGKVIMNRRLGSGPGPHEVELHLRDALHNGCTKEEIMEVLLQTAIQRGVPAAVDRFGFARKIFSESEAWNILPNLVSRSS